MKRSDSKAQGESASALITQRIADLDDWRGELLAEVRATIQQADPAVVEEWKWGIPVWSHDGILCTGETYKNYVKLTFAKGASLKDPSRLFNASLEGNTRRAIDLREGVRLDKRALKALIGEAVALNSSGKKSPAKTKAPAGKAKAAKTPAVAAKKTGTKPKRAPAKKTPAKKAAPAKSKAPAKRATR